MASSCEKLDQLVKDYLLFRGFSSTLKTLDQELKTDKDKGLRVDRMMDQIWVLLSSFDLTGLREYWKYLSQRLFSRLEQRYTPSVRKLESGLLKLYIVNAHQSGRQDKVKGFFEAMGPELKSYPDFKEWFAFPFVNNPAENQMFSLYFQKQWQDTLHLSLHNFLSVVLQAMPVPTLLNVEFDARRMKILQEENTSLKQQLMNMSSANASATFKESRSGTRKSLHSEMNPPASPPDMVYDFSGLSNDTVVTQEKQKNTRRFPLSLTSPLSGRKKADSAQSKSKPAPSAQAASSAPTLSAPSSNISKQGKVTEMSQFPPSNQQSLMAGQRDLNPRRASAGPAASLAAPSSPKLSSAPHQASPPGIRKQVSVPSDSSHGTDSDVKGPNSKNRSTAPPNRCLSDSTSETSRQQLKSTDQTSQSLSGAGRVPSAALDTESNLLISADSDSPFLLLEDEYKEHASSASLCRFSMAGQYVASLDVDGIVKVWMWSPQPATQATIMSKSAFLSLAWVSKSDRWLLLGNKTGTIRLFDVNESKTFREVLVQPDSPANCMRVTHLSTNPSSSQFACATSDLCPFTSDLNSVSGRLLLWDLRTLKHEHTLVVDSDVCTAITTSCYSFDGRLLLTGAADGCIRIYEPQKSHRPVMRWQANNCPVQSAQFGGDGTIFTMAADGMVNIWSTSKSGQLLNSLSQGSIGLGQASSSSSSGRLFALDLQRQYMLTCSDKKGILYKVCGDQPEKVMELKSHSTPVVTVDWSPCLDTRVCLTGSTNGRIKISTLLSK